MTTVRLRTALVVLGVACLVSSACAGSSTGAGATSTTVVAPTSPSTTTAAPSTAATEPAASGASPVATSGAGIVVRAAATVARTAIDATLRTPDGRDRTYHLFVPSSVRAGTSGPAVPLLVALHGGLGSGRQFERNSGYDGLAQANGFVVVYPDGVGTGPSGTSIRTWNGGRCCGPAVKHGVDDVGFIRMLIARIEAQYPIDRGRVFASGHSNGGILAYRLACELSDQIAAIGVQSTALEVAPCRPAKPVSVLHIHGAADQNIPIGGGVGPKAVSGVAFSKPIDGAAAVAEADGCGAPSTRVDAGNRDLSITTWSSCPSGITVGFVRVAGASHAWMGHATGASGLTGPPYTKLDSSLVLWNFLSQHPRR